jgi:hypothetical protein
MTLPVHLDFVTAHATVAQGLKLALLLANEGMLLYHMKDLKQLSCNQFGQ